VIRPVVAMVTFLTIAATPAVSDGTSHFRDTLRPIDTKEYAEMITAHHGHVLVVDFWATWCSSCREEMPGIVALAQGYAQAGVELATVSADDPGQMQEAERFLDSVRAPAARYVKRSPNDDAFIAAIDTAWTGALPALFVYDRAGRKVRTLFGETPGDAGRSSTSRRTITHPSSSSVAL
jgi:thiol-disulfide isomerase/thioredoxin